MAKNTPVMRTIDGVTRLVPALTRRQIASRWLKHSSRSRNAVIVTVIIAGFIITYAVYKLVQKSNDSGAQQLIAAVEQHVILPSGEQPIIATVTNKSLLKTAFLQEASNGDKILIYQKAKRVIIYRPLLDRIVDIGPIELGNIPNPNK